MPRGTHPVQDFARRHSGQDLTAELASKVTYRIIESFSGAIKVARATLRPGVRRLIQQARADNFREGLITTFERKTLVSMIAASDGLLDRKTCDVIVWRGTLVKTKLALRSIDSLRASWT